MKFILTGIPRSGTSLMSSLICKIENAYCLNEILYKITTVSDNLSRAKLALMHGAPIPNRYSGDKLTTNTSGSNGVEERVAEGDYNKNCVVGSKVNTPYLKFLQYFIENDEIDRIIILVRDPIYAIGSFHNRSGLNISKVGVGNLDPRFWDICFPSENVIERQAIILNHYFRKINIANNYNDKVMLIRYEDLTLSTPNILDKVSDFLGVEKLKEYPILKLMNKDKRYSENVDMVKVKQAVNKYCEEEKGLYKNIGVKT